MQISDITRGKKTKVNEVNWGAIGGALTGIASQAVTGKTPQAAPGQEAKVAQQIIEPLQKQQINALLQAWAGMVANKMAELKTDDPSQIGAYPLAAMLTDYINNRLFAGRTSVSSLPGRFKTAAQADIRAIVTGTRTGDNNLVATHLENLVKNVQAATVNQVFRPGGTAPQLTPAAQAMMQRMAPQIAQLQRQWPAGQNQQVMPTNNQAVNALLAGLGLLRTSSSPVVPGAPQQTPPPPGTK